ncbi:hypothetical protein EJ06DRAFT_307167 [Trichodelitschia bisporula]|uniref:Yeast cell wall synthesis Kre9/Knh1-like N-terminal domain-containing protein n=1 Tax=Trichodelitschia bisporula TaxID=703511 RepID=A0A6G1I3F8_9PEZI|nr:hypothetical protein EJ06DRAFT_307167 [Trichodelitschia bisporula]
MKFTAIVISAFAALAAALDNPLVPVAGALVAGQPTTITWQPTTSGTVSLQLRWGDAGNLNPGTSIAASVQNSGTYSWTPPSDLPSGTTYAIEIIDDSNKGNVNYTPQFTVSGTSGPLSSAVTGTKTASSASTDSASASSSASASESSKSASASASSSASASASSSSASESSSASRTATPSTTRATVATVPSSGAGRTVGGEALAALLGLGAVVAMI